MDLKVMYDQLMGAINEIDEKLDSRTDGKAAGKRTIISNLIEQTADSHASIVQQFIDQLANVDVAKRSGIYLGITRGLAKAFDSEVQEYVNSIVETQPVPEPLCTEEEAADLSKVRSDLYQKVKKLVELSSAFPGAEEFEMPRRRTGATGKRGPRAMSFISWSIGDDEFDSLKDVWEKYSTFYAARKDLTAAIRESGVDLKNPPEEITFDLPDGKTLVGVYTPPADADESDED